MFFKERNASCSWDSRPMDLESRLFPPGAAAVLEGHSEMRGPNYSERAFFASMNATTSYCLSLFLNGSFKRVS